MVIAMSMTIEFRPVVEQVEGGWQAKAAMYEDKSIFTAVEIFNAWTEKQEAWNDAKNGAAMVVKQHNDNCKCGKTAVVGSY